MDIIELLNNPLFNAVFGGILIYLLIYLSNLGHPAIGAILSSFPVGLLGLMAIKNRSLRNNYINSAVYVNIIIVIMWVVNNHISHYIKNTMDIVGIAAGVWLTLSVLYYFFVSN